MYTLMPRVDGERKYCKASIAQVVEEHGEHSERAGVG